MIFDVNVLAVSVFVNEVKSINQVISMRFEILCVVAEVPLVDVGFKFLNSRLHGLLLRREINTFKHHIIFVSHKTQHPCAGIYIVSLQVLHIPLPLLVATFRVVVKRHI